MYVRALYVYACMYYVYMCIVYVCVCVCVHVSVYVCMYLCLCVHVYICVCFEYPAAQFYFTLLSPNKLYELSMGKMIENGSIILKQ